MRRVQITITCRPPKDSILVRDGLIAIRRTWTQGADEPLDLARKVMDDETLAMCSIRPLPMT